MEVIDFSNLIVCTLILMLAVVEQWSAPEKMDQEKRRKGWREKKKKAVWIFSAT